MQLFLDDPFAGENLWMNFLAKQNNDCYIFHLVLVGVAQLVEHWVVASVVAGSSPVIHPREKRKNRIFRLYPVFLFTGLGHGVRSDPRFFSCNFF